MAFAEVPGQRQELAGRREKVRLDFCLVHVDGKSQGEWVWLLKVRHKSVVRTEYPPSSAEIRKRPSKRSIALSARLIEPNGKEPRQSVLSCPTPL